MRVHAVYVLLNDLELFKVSLASVYDHVDGITVTTAYDRDWVGRPWAPEAIVDTILSRDLDPERKINLLVPAGETNEARARNRAMDAVVLSRAGRKVITQHDLDQPLRGVDYFWIVDSDEIYEDADIGRLHAYVDRHRRPYLQVPAVQYFHSFNHRVKGYEWFTAFVRADRRLGNRRNPFPTHLSRLAHRLPIAPHVANRSLGMHRISPEVGIFHHATYVGPRERIEAKVRSSSHAAAFRPSWLEEVWDRWDPSMTNLHPVEPSAMPSTTHVPTSELPKAIREHRWSPGYLNDQP